MVHCHNVSFKTPFKVDAEIDYMLCTENFTNCVALAVAQSIRVFAPQAEGWVFESKPQQT